MIYSYNRIYLYSGSSSTSLIRKQRDVKIEDREDYHYTTSLAPYNMLSRLNWFDQNSNNNNNDNSKKQRGGGIGWSQRSYFVFYFLWNEFLFFVDRSFLLDLIWSFAFDLFEAVLELCPIRGFQFPIILNNRCCDLQIEEKFN